MSTHSDAYVLESAEQLTHAVSVLVRELNQVGSVVVHKREPLDSSRRGLVSVKTAAQFLDMSKDMILELINEGVLDARVPLPSRKRKTMFVTVASINRLVEGK